LQVASELDRRRFEERQHIADKRRVARQAAQQQQQQPGAQPGGPGVQHMSLA
jgi:hypothetical protein